MEWLTIPAVLLLGNLAVYIIHRFPLHTVYKPIYEHTFKVHTEYHHYFFTNELIIYEGLRDFYILFFPPTVVLGFACGLLPLSYFILSFFASANVIWLYLGTSALYFLLYEVFHYISHLPEDHAILVFPPFRHMRNHHVTHHNTQLMYRYNFNIVYPLCDVLFGSVYKGEEEGVSESYFLGKSVLITGGPWARRSLAKQLAGQCAHLRCWILIKRLGESTELHKRTDPCSAAHCGSALSTAC